MITEQPTGNNWYPVIKGVEIPKANNKGMVVPLYYNHEDRAVPFGAAYDVKKKVVKDEKGKSIKALVGSFEIDRNNEEGKRIDDGIQNGYIGGVSVGMIGEQYDIEEEKDKKGNVVHTVLVLIKSKLDELSITPHPADINALIKAQQNEKNKEQTKQKVDEVKKVKQLTERDTKEIARKISQKMSREIYTQCIEALK